MKLAVTYPDPEIAAKDYLQAQMALHEPTVTVGIGVPSGWTPASPPHVQVALDGVPTGQPPVYVSATIRLVARAASTSTAKRLAALAQGLLLAHPGTPPIASTGFYTGVLPARDAQTRAELASVTCRVTVRSTPIPAA